VNLLTCFHFFVLTSPEKLHLSLWLCKNVTCLLVTLWRQKSLDIRRNSWTSYKRKR